MAAKLTTEDVRKRLLEKNIVLLSEYNGIRNHITCKCHCGNVFTKKARLILVNYDSCDECSGRKVKLTTEDVRKRLLEKNIELLSEYNGLTSDIECKCHCGKIFTKKAHLILYRSNSCDECSGRKVKLTTEDVRKRLLEKNIILLSEYNGLTSDIECKCHCGKIFTRNTHSVLYGSNSCGCLMYQYNSGNKSYLWRGYGEISKHIWHSIKRNALKRKLDFDVDLEYVWDIFLQQNKKCNYSGIELVFNTNHNDRNTRTASLDRIDSSKGYIEENVQWIHKDVNMMKWDMDYDYFIHLCELICNPIKNEYPSTSCIVKKHQCHNYGGYGNIYKSYWTTIERRSEKTNKQFDISIEYAWELFLKQNGYCKLTGLDIFMEYRNKQTASLDRIDCSKGYIEGNVQWVHKDVNRKLKGVLDEEKLKQYCLTIINYKRDKT